MKKILMIAYEYPPVGGIGVQRILKFTKYLPKYGWKPIVLTVRNPVAKVFDPLLTTEISPKVEVYRTSSLEPQKICRTAERAGKKILSILDKVLRTNKLVEAFHWRFERLIPKGYNNSFFFIPDRDIGWFPFAVLKGWEIIERRKVERIFTTGPPHSTHMIGLALKIICDRPWVADFRDPWTEYIHWFPPTVVHRKFGEFMERIVIEYADKIISVVDYMTRDFIDKYPQIDREKFITIPNGFDTEDYKVAIPKKDSKFTITYTGTFWGYHSYITPHYFLRALRELLNEKKWLEEDIRVVFVGNFSNYYKKRVKDLFLDNIVLWPGFVSHRESIAYILSSDVLLLIVGTGKGSDRIFTGKVFEYLGAKRPILGLVVPNGVAARLIRETRSGIIVPPEDIEAIKRAIYDLYLRYKKGNLYSSFEWKGIQKYEREKLTEKLASLL